MKNKPVLYIIIPCYNEEKVLPITAPLFKQEIMKLINRKIKHGMFYVNWQRKMIAFLVYHKAVIEDIKMLF